METPSTRGFNVQTLDTPAEWAKQLDPIQTVTAMEHWAIANLRPREAAIGTYSRKPGTRYNHGALANYWILRHNDYSTGRANIEIQIREIVREKTFVWVLKDDELKEGRIVEMTERAVYVRGVKADGTLVWDKYRALQSPTTYYTNRSPAARLPMLYMQCFEMANELAAWLQRNVRLLSDHDQYSVFQQAGLSDLMCSNMLWLATHPHGYEEYLSRFKINKIDLTRRFEEEAKFLFGWRDELSKKNRIAEPEHYALYHRLQRSVDFILKHRRDPLTRPISSKALIRLQKRWINAIRPLLDAYSGRVS